MRVLIACEESQAMAEQWGDYEDRKHKSMKGGKR